MKNLSYMPNLKDLSIRLETHKYIAMLSTAVIISVSIVTNSLALSILIYAKNKLPRIIGCNYLILLVLTNSLYLLLQSYMSTYNYMIYFFEIDYDRSFQLFDSSTICCKMLLYLRYCTRHMNAALTACFSIERLLAVYRPLHMRSQTFKCSLVFKSSIGLSILLPSYSIFLAELIPVDHKQLEIYRRHNFTKSFNPSAMTPLFGKYTCSASSKNFLLFMKLHFAMLMIVFISYILVSLCIFAIIVKLKKKKSFIFFFRSNINSNSTSLELNNIVRNNQQTEDNQNSIESEINNNSNNETRKVNRSFSKFELSVIRQPKSTGRWINRRVHDTRILSSISICFVILNTPYFISMFRTVIFAIKTEGQDRYTPDNLVIVLNVHSSLVISEVFQLLNFSLTGLLFFCSGKIFRLHAIKFFKNGYLYFKNKIPFL